MTDIRLSRLPAADATDTELLTRVSALVNDVYADAEAGLWQDGTARTSTDEVAGLTAAGQIAVARLGTEVVGCVRVQSLDDDTAEFGMLAADPAHRRRGIGRDLVAFAERTARDGGHRVMQLEVLTPRTWEHPSKVFLADWYGRLGYRRTDVSPVEKWYPDLAPLLATSCDLVIYRKPL
ncbi:GNAT family N-acetyltransferase [Nonomuraea solani]|uniref:GNAT family N-acetyltransferase n=1 Tax=Nonomuraea solani TaxID=1144553 RepID=UPI00190ECFB4|nr:GNAT family N-acetyltransferase [Nonomuraea solani]